MRFIDITRVAQDAPIYPGSNPIEMERICDMSKGGPFNASLVTSGSHMGTHADAYCHFLPTSEITIDKMELWRYYGPCRVITVPENSIISLADVEGKLDGTERVAIRGGGLSYLGKEAAEYIRDCGIVTVVIDAWSVGPLDNESEIHGIILGAGLAIVENVCLDDAPDGDYTLCAFPVKYGNCDGAPTRAVLIAE